MMIANELQVTIEQTVLPGKDILAADESQPNIAKRFAAIGVAPTLDNCRANLTRLYAAPGIEEYISGVIEFEDTLEQSTDEGTLLPKVLARSGIFPGIKV